MKSILEEFYYGNINPNAKCFDRDSEYAKFLDIVVDSEKKLNSCLNDDEKRLFEQFVDAQYGMTFTSERERFVEGFRLGARFMLDVFVIPPDNQIKDIRE